MAGPFITGAKTGKAEFKKPKPESPTAKAARALAIFNKTEDNDIEENEEEGERYISRYKTNED